MSKIDLLDQKWIDLVFEGKNEAYGAYALRQDTSKRNLFAMLALFAGLIAIVATFLIVNVASEAIARAQAEHETEVTLEQIEEEAEEQEEEEVVYEVEELEQLVAEETVMNSEKFTAYEMEDDAPEQVTKTQDEVAQSDVAIGAIDYDQGSDEAEHVLKVNEKVVDEVPPAVEETKVFDVVEQMPQYKGGDQALMDYLNKSIKYPVIAEENGIQGRVVCTFVVERDGSITDVKVVRSVDPSLDKEAVRVLKAMPKWIPGKQNGSAVRVKFTLPVTFKLQ
ncbi:energy transducer TonB [uncultured Prevotella sp.]|uniref:energy transducer TonB n=1 Tax=uncultured Prevotella sp. TaxID=159272 RepID=UPI0025FEC22B|nr:energy transducer TonB [uncultured Prevotella sp.]